MSNLSNTQAVEAAFYSADLANFSLWESEEAPKTEYHYSQAAMQSYTLRVKDLPAEERPRDRLMVQGVKSLSTGELLAILLGTGQGAGKLSAVGLGQHILQTLSEDQRNPIENLRDINAQELMQISGIGPAKAATILAALELGKRVFHARPPERTVIADPATAATILTGDLMWQSQEKFAVLFLDVKNRLLGNRVVSIGTATETLVHPRDVFREVIRQGATRMIVAHNHPSGILEASPEDLALTRLLLQGGQLLNIPVLDHLILGAGNHLSIRQTTDLWSQCPQD